jgi:hypothetical protein
VRRIAQMAQMRTFAWKIDFDQFDSIGETVRTLFELTVNHVDYSAAELESEVIRIRSEEHSYVCCCIY